MTELELLEVIGFAQDAYVLDADALPKKKQNSRRPGLIRCLAAMLAIVLAAALFFQTPLGAAAAEELLRFLEILFPPKQLVVQIEGMPETIPHEAQGREPQADTPGFAIYVDTSLYTMTQEGESWFIRPIPIPYDREEIRRQESARLEGLSPEAQEELINQRIAELEAFYASLPPVEIEIQEHPSKTPLAAAEEVHGQMAGQWESLTDLWSYWREDQKEGIRFYANQGSSFDDAREAHYFLDNSRGGCFHIVSRTYQEASEGHGTRFTTMIGTFTTVAPQDPSQYSTPADTLVRAMEQEVAYAKEQNAVLLEQLKTHCTQADMNTNAMDRSALWHDVHNKLWTALEQTMDSDAMACLTREHYEWASRKREVLDATGTDLEGGSMTGLAVYGTDAKWTEQRAEILLAYLQGSAALAPNPEGLELSPNALVEEFTQAYFLGDTNTLCSFLSRTYQDEAEGYPNDPSTVVIHTTKNLHDIPHAMTQWGRLTPSIEFRETADSDSYTYLSITLIWENNRWAVSSYGLEK